MELQVLYKTTSHLWFHANKKYKNAYDNSARHTSSQRHIGPYAKAEVTISVREYPENYQK